MIDLPSIIQVHNNLVLYKFENQTKGKDKQLAIKINNILRLTHEFTKKIRQFEDNSLKCNTRERDNSWGIYVQSFAQLIPTSFIKA